MPETEKVEELWDDFLRGEIDESSARSLLTWLQAHPDELAARRKEASLSASLDCLLGPKKASERLVKSVLARVEGTRAGEGSGRFRKRVMESVKSAARAGAGIPQSGTERPRHAPRKRHPQRSAANSFWPAAAAALVIGALALYFLSQPKPQTIATTPEIPQPTPIPTPAPKIVEAPWGTLAVRNGSVSVNQKTVTGTVPLGPGNHVELLEHSIAELTLKDGTTLQLAELSILDVAETPAGNRVVLKHGSTDVHAAKQLDGKQFTIETPHAKVRVLGTQYTVNAFERFSHVAVNSGKVEVMSSVTDAANAKGLLGGGEEILADAKGLDPIRRTEQHRLIAVNESVLETYTDPGVKKEVGDRFRGMPLERLTYNRPKKRDAYGYSGIAFPIHATPGEVTFDVWIRPRWIKPEKEEFRLMKVAMHAQMGSTEYRIGAIELYPGEKDWVVLRGRLSAATVHWTEPGTKQIPARPELIQNIALRTEIGEIEFDHTGVIVWRDSGSK
jgi:hypothetical protein